MELKQILRGCTWIGGLLAAMSLLALILLPANAEAANARTVALSVELGVGTDSSNYGVDSVVFRALHRRANNFRWYWLGKGSKATIADSNTNSTFSTDSLEYHLEVPIDSFEDFNTDYGWMPRTVAWVYWNDGQIDRADAQMSPTLFLVDTLTTDVSATATIDYDTLAGIVDDSLSATHGAGSWTSAAAGTGAYTDSVWVAKSSDTTAIGSGVAVWLTPDGGGTVLKDLTDANSWAVFSVDADTYLVTMWVVGYYTTTVPDTNEVDGANTKDTVYMTATTAASPPAAGLTPITFNFFDGTGDSVKNVGLRYHLDAGGADVAYHFDSTKIFDPTEVFESWTDASGQVTVNVVPNDSIYVRGLQTGKTRWVFRAYSPETGKELFGPNGIKLNVTASATALTYPKDFTE